MENYSSTTDTITSEDILKALKNVIDPISKKDVVSANMISGVSAKGTKIGFLITISPEHKAEQIILKEQCEQAALKIKNVSEVSAVLTAHNQEPIQPTKGGAYSTPRERAVWNLTPLGHVKKIIAIASGKGGVGKSTIAALLAMALAKQGKKVGLLDADIYGPSIPTLFHISSQPDIQDGKMVPILAHGVHLMSMGLISGDQAAILRAPMVTKALAQMLKMTRWGTQESPMDVLLVDMPPGTGDIHLSMVQQVPLDGAIIVTLPSELSIIDAKKSLNMFEKTGVPILGIIENMSVMEGGITPFGNGGGKKLTEATHAKLLAELPLDAEVGAMLNKGVDPYDSMASHKLLKELSAIAAQLI